MGSQGIAKKMMQIQHSAALTITGAMRTSPTDSTAIHANLMPMSTVIQRMLFNLTLCMTMLPPSHPLHGMVARAAKCNVVHHKTVLHCLVHGLKLKQENTETFIPCPVHPNSLMPFTTDIAPSKEDTSSNFQQCTDDTMVFMDGSCHNGQVRAAVSLFINKVHKATLRFHLGSATAHTVFEAEAVGLILATQLLVSTRGISFPASIYADNQAVIQSSTHPSASPGHYLLIHFRKLARHLCKRKKLKPDAVSVKWIVGHMGNWGKELADREVRLAADHADHSSLQCKLLSALKCPLPSSTSALKQHHNGSLLMLWSNIWCQSPRHPHIASIDPSLPLNVFTKLTKSLGKRHTVIYTQLRMGHIPLNKHLHRIKRSGTTL